MSELPDSMNFLCIHLYMQLSAIRLTLGVKQLLFRSSINSIVIVITIVIIKNENLVQLKIAERNLMRHA